MKISLNLTAESLINALRWKRQDLLEMKRPDIAPKPPKRRRTLPSDFQMDDMSLPVAPRKRALTKVQRRALERVAARASGAHT